MEPQPSERGKPAWRRWVFPSVAMLGLGMLVSLAFRHPLIARDDFWNHVAVGRWICQNERLPERTLHLWTADQPHIYHSWLTQVSLYGLSRAVSVEQLPTLALAFAAAVVLAGLGLMWCVGLRCGGFTTGLALASIIAIEASAGRFQVRPDLFTSLFIAALLAFLALWSGRPREAGEKHSSRSRFTLLMIACIACFSVWANFHGAVAFGLVLLGLTAGCDLIQDRFDRRSRRLALLALAAPVGVSLNPYGLEYWSALLAVRSETFSYILEWAPAFSTQQPLREGLLARAIILGLIALTTWTLNPRRRLAQLLWIAAFFVLFLQARRNIWPYCQVCLAVVAVNAARMEWAALPARATALPRVIVRTGLLVWIALECVFLSMETQSWRPMGPAVLETGPVRFVLENRLDGRLFNDAEVGSYLQWRFDGAPPLYLDIINAYPVDVVRNQIEIARCTPRGKQLLDEQGIEIVLLSADRGPLTKSLARLADHLDASPEWSRVHASRGGMVWVRRNDKYQSIWRPRESIVHPVRFAVLEEHARDRERESPPLSDDLDREHGRQPPPVWRLFERGK